jgi:hypothetical protein
VAVLLAGFGVLAARYAGGRREREPGAQAFALVGALVWAGRAALELRFPLQVPLLGLRGLSPVILGGSVVLCALFVIAWARSGEVATASAGRDLDAHPE